MNETKDKGRFYCHWCGEMHPIEDRREDVDETEYVIWVGCKGCFKKWLRRDK